MLLDINAILILVLLIASTILLYGPEQPSADGESPHWRNRALFGLFRGIALTAMVAVIALRLLLPSEFALAWMLGLVGVSFVASLYTPVLIAYAIGTKAGAEYWSYLQYVTKWSRRRLVVFSVWFCGSCLFGAFFLWLLI